jgi:hypothetical protein
MTDKKSKRVGDIITVENTERKFGSANEYMYMMTQLEDGTEIPILFTIAEFHVMMARAEKNTEDLPKVGWLRNILT